MKTYTKKRGYKKENTKSGNKERKKNEKAQKIVRKNGTTGRTSIISICTIIKRGTIVTTTYC